MKTGPALMLFFVTSVLCLASYEFLDPRAARFFSTSDQELRRIFDLITWLGWSTPYLAATLAAFLYFRLFKKNRTAADAAAFLFAAVALSGLANDAIKFLVGRSRPGLLLSSDVYGFKPFARQYLYASFPSGHANTIAALCYGLFLATGRFKYALTVLALTVMLSRVVVEAHYPSDVLFGACLGVLVTDLVAVLFEKKGHHIRGIFAKGSQNDVLQNR